VLTFYALANIVQFLNQTLHWRAATSAAAWSCGNSVAVANLEVTASHLAKATAEAISLAYVNCRVDDGGYVCASADSSVSVWVDAVAQAWASSWSAAITCKDKCKVNVDSAVDAVGTILVDAATKAYTDICAGVSPAFLAMTEPQ
jgi:hypothetical protein